jgi:hypothetical protein
MDHAALVGVLNRATDPGKQLQDLILIILVREDKGVEMGAVDKLHGIEVKAVPYAAVIDLRDAGVLEAAGERDFAFKAGLVFFGDTSLLVHQFDGDFACGGVLPGAPDGAHAPDAEKADDAITGNGGDDGQFIETGSRDPTERRVSGEGGVVEERSQVSAH